MALTKDQLDLLGRMIESRSTRLELVETLTETAALVGDSGDEQFPVNASDVRELEAQQLIRSAGGSSYEVTNDGRITYEQQTSPPPKPRPVGF